jgi:osmoprotectant transport system substrate-binding protein
VLALSLVGALSVASLPFSRAAVAAHPATQSRALPTINIGEKNFDEEYIIGDMYSLLLNKAGFPTHLHVLGSNAPPFQKALLSGQLDLYPEYTGTGLTVILSRPGIANAATAYSVVKSQYKKKWNLIWLNQTPMNDTNAVAVTKATAAKYHLKNLSNLAKAASNLTFAALPECNGRADCLGGLQNVYGIHFKSVQYVASTSLTLSALKAGQVDAAEIFGTSPAIKADNLQTLADNKAKVFPADHIAPVVRGSILAKHPQIATILDKVAPYLTTKAVIRLNAGFDLQHQDAMALARQFLQSKHLL